MYANKSALPKTGYDVLAVTLHAYLLCESPTTGVEEVAAIAGTQRGIVLSNDRFLISFGLLAKGTGRALTTLGRQLAIALRDGDEEHAGMLWRQICGKRPTVKKLLQNLRAAGPVSKEALSRTIAAAFDQPDDRLTRRGANTLTRILQIAGCLRAEEEQFVCETPELAAAKA
ncbi:MAG TPA: hypothetical protein VGP72_22395 [Planctomycetota bacterium]|jgi:hypothetical protein